MMKVLFSPHHPAQITHLHLLPTESQASLYLSVSLYQLNSVKHTHTHTHTRSLPTLLLTTVCSETVKSQRCNLSSEPLVELFYVVELMQLFFSGQ